MSKFIIYGLVDPRTDEVRYIGKSTTGMRRPRTHGQPHMLTHSRSPKSAWIRALLKQGLEYRIKILEVSSRTELNDAEYQWISQGRERGWLLFNRSDGGDGQQGFHHTAESRAKISASSKGMKRSEATRVKMRLSNRRVISVEQRAIMSAALREHHRLGLHVFTAETRAKISAANRLRARPRMRINLLNESEG